MHIDSSNIDELALGCAYLGSGGGGDICYDLTMAKKAIQEYGQVSILPLEALPSNGLILPVGFMGAPLDPGEGIAGFNELMVVIHTVERYYNEKVSALVPLEIGGGNGLTPLAHAGRMGISVVDADLIGRAFPQLHMTKPALMGHIPSPAFLADARGTSCTLKSKSTDEIERLARLFTANSGSVTALGTYVMRKEEAQKALMLGSYKKAIMLGRMLQNREIPGRKIAKGTVIEFDHRLEGGFLKGTIALSDGTKVYFQNEYLLAKRDDEIIGESPDLLVLIDKVKGEPVSIERMRLELELELYSYEGDSCWKTQEALAITKCCLKENRLHIGNSE